MKKEILKTRLKTLKAKSVFREKMMASDVTIIKMTFSAIDDVFIIYKKI